MKIKCKGCGVEFEPKRSDQVFHDSTCKLKFFRDSKKGKEVKTVIKMIETVKEEKETVQVSISQKKEEVKGWTQSDIDNWKVGDRAFWPSEVEFPTMMPNWVRNGLRTKKEALAHVLDMLQANRERILSHGLDGELTFTLGNDVFELKGKKPKSEKGIQTLEVKNKVEKNKSPAVLDWDKPEAIPVVCGVCRNLKENCVYVKYTDVNGNDSDPMWLCGEDLKKLQGHQIKQGGTITHLEPPKAE